MKLGRVNNFVTCGIFLFTTIKSERSPRGIGPSLTTTLLFPIEICQQFNNYVILLVRPLKNNVLVVIMGTLFFKALSNSITFELNSLSSLIDYNPKSKKNILLFYSDFLLNLTGNNQEARCE